MQTLEPVLRILPPEYRAALQSCGYSDLTELRLRAGRAPCLLHGGGQLLLDAPPVRAETLQTVLQAATGQSAYAAVTLRQGYLTLPGGHRLGLCGTAVLQDGGIRSLKEPSSVCIRIAADREVPLRGLEEAAKGNLLLIGPPCSGKTTLLRCLLRRISRQGVRVGLADERSEVAACFGGVPQMDVGPNTDVLSAMPKAQALMQLLRTMNPQLLACDEITAPEDVEAVRTCSYCGVKLLATAHAERAEDLIKRPLYRALLQLRVFERLAVLTPDRQFHMEEAPEC